MHFTKISHLPSAINSSLRLQKTQKNIIQQNILTPKKPKPLYTYSTIVINMKTLRNLGLIGILSSCLASGCATTPSPYERYVSVIKLDETKDKNTKVYKDIKKLIEVVGSDFLFGTGLTQQDFALYYAKANTPKKQIKLYEEFLERYPKEYNTKNGEIIEVTERLADCYKDIEEYEKAINLYERLIQDLPNLPSDIQIHYNLYSIKESKKKCEEELKRIK